MRKIIAVLALALGALSCVGAHAQSVQQSGSVTRGHLPAWAGSGVVQDGGTSANPQLNAVAAYGSGGCPISITSTTTAGAPTGNYLQGCLSASNAGVQLSVTPFGSLGAQPFIININGTTYSIGGTNWLSAIFDQQFSSAQGSVLYRNATTWVALPPGNSGQVLQTLGAGQNVQWGGAGGVGSVTSITAGTGLTGGTITTSGTIALSNPVAVALGGTSLATLTAHNVMIGEGTSQIAFAAPGVAGQCLASNGATSDPTFQSCPGTGTVTSITAGNGATVSPSPLTSSGTVSAHVDGTTITDSGGPLVVASTTVAGATCTPGSSCGFSTLTAVLGSDVNLNNEANFFDGPSVAQGSSGTWCATATATFLDTAGGVTVWGSLNDGTNVIASGASTSVATSTPGTITLSGCKASPAGNLRISLRDNFSTTGVMKFNSTGLAKDTNITVWRIN